MLRRWTKNFGRIDVDFELVAMGKDLCIIVTGGIAHIGAVALAQGRPSLSDFSKRSASTSVLTLLGHKEDEVAKHIAQLLATKLDKNVVVCCGIHVDEITSGELQFIKQAIDEICDKIIANHT